MDQNPTSFIPPLAFFNSIGPVEIGIIAFLALLFFGGKRLPALAKDLGSGIKEFRKSLTGPSDEEITNSSEQNNSITEKVAPKAKKKKT